MKRVNKKRKDEDKIENLKTDTSKKITKKKQRNIVCKLKDTYIGYTGRVFIFLLLFLALFGLSYFLITKFFSVSDSKIINYRENGSLDYKVYLKENEFYETPYLEKDMLYIASLIKNINLEFNYQFIIGESKDLNFDYNVVANLKITDQSESNVYYEKNFTILQSKKVNKKDSNQYLLNESISVDYDYYNSIANNFKTQYGIDGVSNLTIYLKINKNILETENSILSNANSMSVKIPLSQKSLNIKLDTAGINSANSIVTEKSVQYNSILFVIFAVILFIASVACLLRLLELLALLMPKKSNYDKQVEKILKEYDRLIVETPTVPDFDNLNIIKIKKIEELLDARDNLKLPIMYHELTAHQKCYFYIKNSDTVYLMILKASDIDVDDKKNKKASKNITTK